MLCVYGWSRCRRPDPPTCRRYLLRFGVCDNALAAADLAAFPDFACRSTLLAASAAFALVCLVFLFAISLTLTRAPYGHAGTTGGQIRVHTTHLTSRQCLEGPALQGRAFALLGRQQRPSSLDQDAPTPRPDLLTRHERTATQPTR